MPTPYQNYILSLTPNHYWILESNSSDSGFGSPTTSTNPPGTNIAYNGTPLTLGSSASTTFTAGRLDFGDALDVNITNAPWFRRSYSMWAQADKFDANYMLYSEGGSVRNITTMFALGGTVQYICDNDGDSDPGCPWSQSVVSPKIKLNTAYHIGLVWESDRIDTGIDGKGSSYMRCYLNGKMIGEKEIYKWDTGNNVEILTEPGGQLNAHSGNIVIGDGRSIIVSKKTFSPRDHQGLVSDVAMWDNVLLSDDVMWQLFLQGALPTTSTVTFTNITNGTEIRLYEELTPFNEIGTGIESSITPEITIDYTVSSTVNVRLVIIEPGNRVFSEIITLPREDSSINASILTKPDLTYNNPI